MFKIQKVFYGWWLVLVASAIAVYSGGVWSYGFSTFIKPITDEFGWSRTAISLGFSLSRLESAVTGIPAGYFSDKLGPRWTMLIGIIVTGAGLMAFSRVDALWNFYLLFIIIALGYGFGFLVPMVTAIANWFDKKSGKAFGLFQAGYAGCGLLPPVLVFLITAYGWRTAVFIAGAGLLVICIPLALFIRRHPEPYGYLPDGEDPQKANQKDKLKTTSSTEITLDESREFSLRQTLAQPSFWLISLSFGVASFAHNAIVVHSIPHLISLGYSQELAALGLTTLIVSSVLGRIGFGWLADVFPKRYIMAICYALELVGVLVLARTNSIWIIFLAMVIFGPGYGGSMPLRVAIQRDYFGRKGFGVLQGTMLSITALPGALGPLFAGWVFDVYGSYYPALLTMTLVYLIAVVMVSVAKPPKK